LKAEFLQNSAFPGLPPQPGNMVTAVQLSVDAGAPARIDAIEFQADAGITAEYLGYTTCKRGCPGIGPLDSETQQLIERGRDGILPIPIPKGRSESLSLIVSVRLNDDGRRLLPSAGCLGVKAVVLKIGGVATVATSPKSYVAALEAREDSRCITR
jgi:hypothetical protein